jgi:hypothetical protein
LEQFRRSFGGKLSFSVSQRVFRAQRILFADYRHFVEIGLQKAQILNKPAFISMSIGRALSKLFVARKISTSFCRI